MMKLNTDHGPQCALPLCRGTAVRHGCTRFRPCGTDPLARLAGSTPLTGLRLANGLRITGIGLPVGGRGTNCWLCKFHASCITLGTVRIDNRVSRFFK
jgi:hypothetical protein